MHHAAGEIEAVEGPGKLIAESDRSIVEPAEDGADDPRAGNCATMFEHIDYGGDHKDVNRGEVPWIGDIWNDEVSSIKVRSGCVLNAYEDKDFRGDQKSFSGNVRRVGDGWNDRISSYTCSC